MTTSVVMVLNQFLNLHQICILQVPRRQPRPGDSVRGSIPCSVTLMSSQWCCMRATLFSLWSYADTSL